MPILILINVQYLQIAVFSFEKGLNGQKHSSSDSHQPAKQSSSPQQNLSFLSPNISFSLASNSHGHFHLKIVFD